MGKGKYRGKESNSKTLAGPVIQLRKGTSQKHG
ncbi:hypothetical protein ARTHRO8AJ_120067 [Arthrobacter sp. 8AJ]|nr:hypothetical protein ARTHRO8AJ_120067 [Arthrobacter sp. 8AJ]